jgi:hypothetical protein
MNEAETSARRGDIALARLRYREAATHFANAAAVFPPNSAHEDKRIRYLQNSPFKPVPSAAKGGYQWLRARFGAEAGCQ